MTEDRRTRLKRWLESGEIILQPLTFPQRELWEASAVPVNDVSNHICSFIDVHGVLTPDDCEAAVQRVLDRQEVLRLSILPGKDRPVQMIRPRGRPTMRFHQLARPEAIEDLMQEVFSEPFDLLQGPLYRADVVRRSSDHHLLVFTIHHAIADGWTLRAFVQDLCAAYALKRMGVPDGLPPVQLSYSAWGAAERASWQPSEIEQHLPFWRAHLAGIQRPWSADPGAVTDPLKRFVVVLPTDLGRAVRELARRTGTTLFSALLTAFRIALARWAGASDVVVGTPVANRNKQAMRETMGYFSGIVPLRSPIEPDRPFIDILHAVHRDSLDCFASAIPFAELVKALGNVPIPPRHPIFDVRFALQNHPLPYVAVPGLSVRLTMRSTGTARFDLGCEVTEDGEALEVVWLFRPKLFNQEEVQRLGSMFAAVLAGVSRSPNSQPAALAV